MVASGCRQQDLGYPRGRRSVRCNSSCR
ncbi:MAG: hypothetical protein IJR01_00195 [Bacteroidales bacterium]|nr:hypothetical protein [Bacteroidales bacterium]